ncbi:RNA polymerase sigma-54 factor [Lysobacter xinjiangensis]|uniref:RNA polymerase sigma-54 factor n=1 Tax=Cognatilysobacter xinjiangensis TaxID=546892 RepID=A0ABQ3BPW8_9GAMM|nr:RNA polymerase factor sigma-54 [Lysobacter xinjiangensis]GGZ53826.1 RNA polymerase sigma-54 factor [Lysobacter xinjiangensis]
MKQRLQASLGQHLVMTPQLQQAIRLLQLSSIELDAELNEAVESNPLLEWDEGGVIAMPEAAPTEPAPENETWGDAELEGWGDGPSGGSGLDGDGMSLAEQVAERETLHDHLLWQLHLSSLSPRDRRIGAAIIDAISDDGYLREPLDMIAASVDPPVPVEDVATVLHCVQHFDPIGVGARSVSEALCVQLHALDADTPGRALAIRIADALLERLPKLGADGIAAELGEPLDEAEQAVALLLSLDPRPGAQMGELSPESYVAPDVTIWRQHGGWRVALAEHTRPRLRINRGYEALISRTSSSDAAYLRSQLQEARWLLRNVEARGETLLRVARCLVQRQSAFLDLGDGALRPLTLREVATEVGLHESTVSRAIARKYARTPRGTLPLRAFFASGVGGGTAEETSSTAVQSMIRQLISSENPRKPLSDARLADLLRASGVPVARRTVAKYREAMSIPSSQDRVRIG